MEKLRKWLKAEYKDAIHSLHTKFVHGPHPIRIVLEMVTTVAYRWVHGIPCSIHGHKWEDLSVAGPDSGDIAYECRNCGETWTHVLY